MQGWLKAYAKKGYKGAKFLPLKTSIKNNALAASPSLDQLQNSENNSLVPQKLKESVTLGVCAQK